MSLVGVVLAGGAARRFGSDKALAIWRGRTLIDHSATALRPFVDRIVVAGRDGGPLGMEGVADWPRTGLGPLGGLCGALRLAVAEGHRGVLSIPCDMPLVPEEVIAELAAGHGAFYLDQAPVLGFWPAALADALTTFLEQSDDRSIVAWARSVGARLLRGVSAIPNINRPGDLDALDR
ncbi:molybdenum cofactor guanylyltransferase [Sphingomonas sp. AX6]|uniref:molybdenum cofactor guanylyltransferase n=1 Tax=Sphingomonas sp. AX6 TaxID=2653171 RepID=UPI0012F1D4C9|nr:molybdenum cofactor guanylyltransferase [Sphingomonas sp. AX6]VXC83710.1 Molybdenum cofactor guanylyltransferase [Sphingomonas sp. AX6]